VARPAAFQSCEWSVRRSPGMRRRSVAAAQGAPWQAARGRADAADAGFAGDWVPSCKKAEKSSESTLTPWRPPAYIRLTNEGGSPLAWDDLSRMVTNSREPRERHSRDLKPEADWSMTLL